MNWLLLFFSSLGGLLLSIYLFPKSDRELKGILGAGAILLCMVLIGTAIGSAYGESRQTVIRTIKVRRIIQPVHPPKVVYRDKIVYRDVGHEFDPVNPDDICTGKRPAQIMKLDVSKAQDGSTTWLVLKPVGSSINITCYIDGDLSNGFWNIGDVVQVKNAKTQ